MPPLLDQVAHNVPHNLALVLHRALSKDPQERYPGIDVFFDAARAAAEASPRSTVHSTIPIANDTTRASVPARGHAMNDPVRTIALLIARARTALLGGDIEAASKLATVVMDSAALTRDEAVNAVIEMGKSFLEDVFHSRLEPLDRRVSLTDEGKGSLTQSQTALLQLQKPHATITELLHSASLPRLEALRSLVELEAQGFVEFIGIPRPRSLGPQLRAGAPAVSQRVPVTLKRA